MKVKLLNELFINYVMLSNVHAKDSLVLSDIDPSTKLKTTQKLSGTEQSRRLATASKQVLIAFKFSFSDDVAFCRRIFLEILNNLQFKKINGK